MNCVIEGKKIISGQRLPSQRQKMINGVNGNTSGEYGI